MTLTSTARRDSGHCFVEERPDRHDASVIDEDIQHTEAPLHLAEKRGEGLLVGHVKRDRKHILSHQRGSLLGRTIIDVANGDPRTPGMRGFGSSQADPPRSASDSDDSAGKRLCLPVTHFCS